MDATDIVPRKRRRGRRATSESDENHGMWVGKVLRARTNRKGSRETLGRRPSLSLSGGEGSRRPLARTPVTPEAEESRCRNTR
eukprot:2610504-Rhodomonas_salina.3